MSTDQEKLKDKSRQSSAPPDENPPAAHKEKVREGGIEADPGDPLERHPTKEPYGAHSGEPPEESGTPETVTHNR